MKQRFLTALAITAVVLPTFLYGGWPFRLVVFFFILTSLYEMYDVKKDKWPIWLYLLMVATIILFAVLDLSTLYIGLIVLLMSLFLITILFEWFTPYDLSYIFTMMVLLTTALRAVFLAVSYGRVELVFILIATYMTDTGAYFSGYFFGKNKLNERISPKKTIEGAIGGWLIGFLAGVAFAYFFVDRLPLNFMIVCSAIIPVISQIGDLAFSSIKRHFNIKDFGTIFPAHGGVLDRIDSLLFSLMAFYILVGIML
ncbi:MAG TPA: phosphatidate cytidylyltransferase [Erysipelotrichaceae bacterium]|nr:phosphatidate cytidylyltransferase [Erysipelotrichaceae bacterium]